MSVFILLLFSASFLSLMFNNCSGSNDFSSGSEDGFTINNDSGDSDEDNIEVEAPVEENDPGRNLTVEEVDRLVDLIPPEQVDDPIPIQELENDPDLFEVYACGGKGVAICHFPKNVDAQGSKCVGRSSVSSHYDHIRQYKDGNEWKEIGDYLGPCRVPLYDSM